MNISAQYKPQLQTQRSNSRWCGASRYRMVGGLGTATPYEKSDCTFRGIAAIVLGMFAWSQVANARRKGGPGFEPVRGDWPDPGTRDKQKWQQRMSSCELLNTDWLALIKDFQNDKRLNDSDQCHEIFSGHGKTYEALIAGAIQYLVCLAVQLSTNKLKHQWQIRKLWY